MTYRALSIDDIAEKCNSAFIKYGVRKAAVFGSSARGEMQRGSDVDLLIDIGSLTSGLIFVELKGWKSIAGLRDITAHKYHSLNLDVVWSVVENDIPKLREFILDLELTFE